MSKTIEKEELESLRTNRMQREEVLLQLGYVNTEAHNLNHLYAELIQEDKKIVADLQSKYGKVNVDIKTGEITPLKED